MVLVKADVEPGFGTLRLLFVELAVELARLLRDDGSAD